MKISEITSFLENAFDILNEKYFDNELPKIVVTVQSSPRGVLGHFTPWNSWKEEDIGYKEINISAENLDRPIENVIATLIHEMVHFFEANHSKNFWALVELALPDYKERLKFKLSHKKEVVIRQPLLNFITQY